MKQRKVWGRGPIVHSIMLLTIAPEDSRQRGGDCMDGPARLYQPRHRRDHAAGYDGEHPVAPKLNSRTPPKPSGQLVDWVE